MSVGVMEDYKLRDLLGVVKHSQMLTPVLLALPSSEHDMLCTVSLISFGESVI